MKHTMINHPFISNLSLSRKVQLQGFKGALVEKVLYVHTFMHIRSIFIRKYSYKLNPYHMAKHTCDSLLDLTSNAKMVTGSPVPYNRFMKCIHQKQF